MTDGDARIDAGSPQPRRILITGGAGFLGSHLAACFQRTGSMVRLLDLAERPSWARAIEYVRGDIRNPQTCATALDGVEVVIHAAFASPRATRELIHRVNIEGTRTLCTQALAVGVTRLLLLSSTIVLWPPKVHPFLPHAPLSRIDYYRAARVEAERLVTAYGHQGLRAAIVRPKTFIGPGCVSAFALIFEWIRLGRRVPVFGRGENRYQLLDIRDMATGIWLLAGAGATGVFSFGARDFRTVREDLQALIDHAQTGACLWMVPEKVARLALRGMELCNVVPLSEWHYKSAYSQDAVVDIERPEHELGWHPQRSNVQALIDAYDWYIASVRAIGTAKATHPIPVAHRVLKAGLRWMYPW